MVPVTKALVPTVVWQCLYMSCGIYGPLTHLSVKNSVDFGFGVEYRPPPVTSIPPGVILDAALSLTWIILGSFFHSPD